MFDQLSKALMEKKAMTKKEPLSHKGGQVEPGCYDDLGETAQVKQMPLTPEQREQGYTKGDIQPTFGKIPMNDREG
jgi:hypothetical protein